MTETTNRRHENRVPISLKAYYSFDRVEGVGVLTNISYSGALIEDTSMQPEVGTPSCGHEGCQSRRVKSRT